MDDQARDIYIRVRHKLNLNWKYDEEDDLANWIVNGVNHLYESEQLGWNVAGKAHILAAQVKDLEEQVRLQREGNMTKIKEIRGLRKDLASLRADYYNMYQELKRFKDDNQD